MPPTPIDQIVAFLQEVHHRPGMYLGGDVHQLVPFLHGFRAACHVFGVVDQPAIRNQIIVQRGWEYRPAQELASQLLERGYPLDMIINETLTCEIETWRQACVGPSNPEAQP